MGINAKTMLIPAVAIILLIGGKFILMSANRTDDKVLVRQALLDSIKASREGRPGGVMDKLSEHIKFNGQSEAGNERDIARYIRQSKPDITVQNMDPEVSGDEAKIISPVTVSMGLLGQSMGQTLKKVTITFRREDDHEWLIFPVKRWKLAEVETTDASVADLATQ